MVSAQTETFAQRIGVPIVNRLRKRFFTMFRRRRVRDFLSIVGVQPDDRILDVGGYPNFWNDAPQLTDITVLNIDPMEGRFESRFHIELGDGTAMNFRDKEFDVVHSNSVIEHLTDLEHQKAFASEIRRVGKKIWVQTPARYFPVEPHYIDFICHWFPKSIQRKLIRNFSFWGLLTRPSQEDIDFCVNSIRLLSRAEFQELFPDCRIHVERVLGWPKSYIAIRS